MSRAAILKLRKQRRLVQKKFMFLQVLQSGENYTDQIRLSFREMGLEIIFLVQFIQTK